MTHQNHSVCVCAIDKLLFIHSTLFHRLTLHDLYANVDIVLCLELDILVEDIDVPDLLRQEDVSDLSRSELCLKRKTHWFVVQWYIEPVVASVLGDERGNLVVVFI
jgi:hypothetical protein